jgi:hypothetical protein
LSQTITTDHLCYEELAEILTEAPSLLQRLIPHLARGCKSCSKVFGRLDSLLARWGHWDPAVVVPEAEVVESHLRELLAAPDRHRFLAVEYPEIGGWCLGVRLLELSMSEEDEERLEYAQLALWMADRLGPDYDLVFVNDLQVRCLARLGTILKSLGEPRSAAQLLRRARFQAEAGSGDPEIEEEVTLAELWRP